MTGVLASLATVVLGVIGFKAWSNRRDRSNTRIRPHSYHSELSVLVDCPVEDVYRFMQHRIPEVYTRVSDMHDCFEILGREALVEGAEVDCEEAGPDEVVHNHYLVTHAVENRLIQMESTPSVARRRSTGRKIGESNSYVYYDFERLDHERSGLTQTIVIDMMNPLYNAMADVVGHFSGSRSMWEEHFREELEGYKGEIERACSDEAR